jgi:hypothetical protein
MICLKIVIVILLIKIMFEFNILFFNIYIIIMNNNFLDTENFKYLINFVFNDIKQKTNCVYDCSYFPWGPKIIWKPRAINEWVGDTRPAHPLLFCRPLGLTDGRKKKKP